ncbi:MAG: DUF2818 family protein [Rhodocyclaceae bacterium]|nr:DUF2818 family protein [Rhodocyclaceae bacterium]
MTAAQTLLIVVALVAANLPFLLAGRFLGFPRKHGKPFWLCLIELLVLYLLIGVSTAWYEGYVYGSAYRQGWEFYAITLCLFCVLSFPGFVYRYLWPGRKHA